MSIAMNARTQPPAQSHSGWHLVSTILKWLARGISLAIALLWGAFFIEHVNEWYVKPPQGFPPTWVLIDMGFHFGMIVGLLTLIRWSRAGAILTLAATCGFFGLTAFHAGLPFIVFINGIPVLLLGAAWLLARPAGTTST